MGLSATTKFGALVNTGKIGGGEHAVKKQNDNKLIKEKREEQKAASNPFDVSQEEINAKMAAYTKAVPPVDSTETAGTLAFGGAETAGTMANAGANAATTSICAVA